MPKRQAIHIDSPYYDKVTYSPAVRMGNLLFISGMGSEDFKTGEIVGKHDVVAQTRKIYENMRTVLEAAGASFDQVVKTVDYIVAEALPFYKLTADIRRQYFGTNFPASTGVIVHKLLHPDVLIEIDAIAVLD